MRDFDSNPLSRREAGALAGLFASGSALPPSLLNFESRTYPPLPEVADPLLVRVVNELHPITQTELDTQVLPRLVTVSDSKPDIAVFNPLTQMHSLAVNSMADLFSASQKAGLSLILRSGFRSISDQQIALGKVNGDTSLVALPGTSQHHTGLAIDFTCPSIKREISPKFGDTTEYSFLIQEAHRYGFVQTYETTTPTHAAESWHWVFIGIPQAVHFQTLKQRGFSGDVFAYQALYTPKSEPLQKRR